jgi:hypothetical protein
LSYKTCSSVTGLKQLTNYDKCGFVEELSQFLKNSHESDRDNSDFEIFACFRYRRFIFTSHFDISNKLDECSISYQTNWWIPKLNIPNGKVIDILRKFGMPFSYPLSFVARNSPHHAFP